MAIRPVPYIRKTYPQFGAVNAARVRRSLWPGGAQSATRQRASVRMIRTPLTQNLVNDTAGPVRG